MGRRDTVARWGIPVMLSLLFILSLLAPLFSPLGSVHAAAVDSIKITSPADGTTITSSKFTASVSYSYKNWNDILAQMSWIDFRLYTAQITSVGGGNKASASSGTMLFEVDFEKFKAQPGKYPLTATLMQSPSMGSPSQDLASHQIFVTYQPPVTPTPTPTPTPTTKPSSTTSPTPSPKPTPTTSPSPTLAPAAIYVYSDPGDARIYLNGVYKTNTNFSASGVGFTDLKPGKYTVDIKKDGFQDYSVTVTLAPNEIRDVRAKLQPGTTATGWLQINSDPSGAQVIIGGQTIGSSPVMRSGVPPGNYTITLKKEGYEDYTDTVTVVAGKTTEVNASLPPVSDFDPLPIAGGAAGVVVVAGALVKIFTSMKPKVPVKVPAKTAPPVPAAKPIPPPSGPPLLGTEQGGKVYYLHPGDEGGPYWMDKSQYLEIVNMQHQGLVYSQRMGGWVTQEAQASYDAGLKKFREDSARSSREKNLKIKQELDAAKARREYERNKSEYVDYLKERQEGLEAQQAKDNARAVADGQVVAYKPWTYTSNVVKTVAQNTSREVFTGVTPEGSFSGKSFVVRIGAAVVSGGLSEGVYAPVEVGYMTNDRMAAGQSFGSALNDSLATEAAIQLLGHGGGKLIGVVGGKIASTTMGQAAVGGIKNAADPVVAAYKAADNRLQQALSALKGGTKPTLTAGETATRNTLTDALKSGDDEAIKKLYQNEGRKALKQLENKGALSTEEAAHLNKVIRTEANGAVHEGTKSTIQSIERDTGVKFKEVLVGDSGSSAGGRLSSVNTDADKTFITRYNKESLTKYAQTHYGGDVKAAKEGLDEAFHRQLQEKVQSNLKKSGLTVEDVDYKAYNGFGESSGHADSYPAQYTQTRQATQGTTTVYKPKADGTVHSYKAGAETITDAHALDKAAQGDLSQLKAGGPKIPQSEIPGLVKQQMKAIPKIEELVDAEKAAKALERLQKARELAGLPGVDPGLMKTANQLRNAPQTTLGNLGGSGQQDFIQKAIREIQNGQADIQKLIEMTGKATLR